MVVVGVLLGVGGELEVGELTAFLFLVALFVQPVQIATEVLNEAQNAVAGWRRVLDVLDLNPDVADPGESGRDLPPGAVDVRFSSVHFAYPGGESGPGPEVLSQVDLAVPARSRVAVVGETGSGKTTFAKLLTRLMDPTQGSVLLAGVPLDRRAVRLTAAPGRARPAGRLPLRRHHRRERALRQAGADRRRT